MKKATHTLLFAGVLGVVCSVLLVGASLFTAPYREANAKAEEVRNFLAALEAPVPPTAGVAELIALFDETVRQVERDGLMLYEYVPSGMDRPLAVAVPFTGAGVWGAIEGVMALEPDLETLRGVRFYRQEETPGLGGEIASEAFLRQFPGRKIVSKTGEPGFRVRKPGAIDDQNVVDAVTGATMTSDRVESMLDAVAKRVAGQRRETRAASGMME